MIPSELLHELPIAREWEDIDTVCAINRELREQINAAIGDQWKDLGTASKKQIAKRILLSRKDILMDLINTYRQAHLEEYDFQADPLGEAIWYPLATSLTKNFPLLLKTQDLQSRKGLIEIVWEICLSTRSSLNKMGCTKFSTSRARHAMSG